MRYFLLVAFTGVFVMLAAGTATYQASAREQPESAHATTIPCAAVSQLRLPTPLAVCGEQPRVSDTLHVLVFDADSPSPDWCLFAAAVHVTILIDRSWYVVGVIVSDPVGAACRALGYQQSNGFDLILDAPFPGIAGR